MKKIWECTWEIAPGDGVHTQRHPTRAAAFDAMRQIICQCTIWLEDLQKHSPEIAEFMNKYLSDPCFPYSADEAPDIWEEFDDLENGELILNSSYIKLHYLCDTVP